MRAQDIAEYFVAQVDEEAGESISNLKVQKLLYYAQGFHLAIYGTPLFPEALKKWEHGPVVPQVYHEFKKYGSGPIPVEPINVEKYSAELRELLDEVFSVYGQFTATKLRNMTHQERPWIEAQMNGEISRDVMKQFFQTLVVDEET